MMFKMVELNQLTQNPTAIKNWIGIFNLVGGCVTPFEEEYWNMLLQNFSNEKIPAGDVARNLLTSNMWGSRVSKKAYWSRDKEYEYTDYMQQLYIVRKFALLDYKESKLNNVYKIFASLVYRLHKNGLELPHFDYENKEVYMANFHEYLLELHDKSKDLKLKRSIEDISLAICDCM